MFNLLLARCLRLFPNMSALCVAASWSSHSPAGVSPGKPRHIPPRPKWRGGSTVRQKCNSQSTDDTRTRPGRPLDCCPSAVPTRLFHPGQKPLQQESRRLLPYASAPYRCTGAGYSTRELPGILVAVWHLWVGVSMHACSL